jgi:hypothetical protein
VRTRGAGEAVLLLLDVVELLGSERIDYAVIGAMVASVHGIARASVAADVVLRCRRRRSADSSGCTPRQAFTPSLGAGMRRIRSRQCWC